MESSELDAIERIQQLKQRFCSLIDAKQWVELSGTLTEDCQLRYGTGPNEVLVGRDHAIATMATSLAALTTLHRAEHPQIELVDGRRGKGAWSLYDCLEQPGLAGSRQEFHGRYHDEYQLGDDGAWRISTSVSTIQSRGPG